ncbi:MAG: PH domain-containing protein [Patescibacteria group bacterium]|nr:PH domain-containing protein [Patescibacteria group bacterium]
MDIKSGQYYSLGNKIFWLFVIQNSAVAIILLATDIALIVARLTVLSASQIFLGMNVAAVTSIAIVIVLIIAVVSELIGVLIAKLKYGISKVMVDGSSLRIVRGVLSKEEIEIPYRRIQSVSIKQSLLYRLLNVGHIAISTTTDLEQPSSTIENETDEEVVPIMDYSLAQAVADVLTSKAEVQQMQMQNQKPSNTA